MKKKIILFGIMTLIAIMGFSITACNKGRGDVSGDRENGRSGGNEGVLTINNLPSNISFTYLVATAWDMTVAPAIRSEFNNIIRNPGYAYDDGIFLAQATVNKPPYSPVSLRSYRHSALTSTFNENGKFLVTVIINSEKPISKFAVIKFTNGSAVIDWNKMTDSDSLP